MRVAYVTSRYPNLSETFITREMRQLQKRGHALAVGRLKWPPVRRPEGGLELKDARVMPYQTHPWAWARGLAWAARHRPAALRSMWRDYRAGGGTPADRVKLGVIFLTTLRLAQMLSAEGEALPSHIRAHHLHSPAVGAMWLSRLLGGVPYSVTVHTLDLRFPRSILEKTLRQAAFVATITEETAALARDLRGHTDEGGDSNDDGVVLVHNGLPVEDFAPVGWALRSDGTNEGGHGQATPQVPSAQRDALPLILGVGNLVEKKGFDTLIRACARLEEGGVPFRCEILGGGKQRAALDALVAEHGLEGRVELKGAQPFEVVKERYAEARVLAMPSRGGSTDGSGRDGLPTVLIEAMALGVPVVSTRFAGIPDLVEHETTGLLADPQAPRQLAAALRRLLADAQTARRLARAGRAKIESDFNIEREVGRLDDAIRRVSS